MQDSVEHARVWKTTRKKKYGPWPWQYHSVKGYWWRVPLNMLHWNHDPSTYEIHCSDGGCGLNDDGTVALGASDCWVHADWGNKTTSVNRTETNTKNTLKEFRRKVGLPVK